MAEGGPGARVSSQTKTSFIIELNDNKEFDILKSLLDPYLPANVVLLNTENDLFNYKGVQSIDANNVRLVNKACRFIFEEREETKIIQAFNYLMQQAHLELVQSIIQKGLTPCVVCSLKSKVKIHDNCLVDIIFNCAVLKTDHHQMLDLYR